MELISQLLLNGFVVGWVYVLVALGMTLVFGVLGVVNFAHGEFYMLGGYVCLLAMAQLGFPFGAAIVVASLFGAVLGGVSEVTVFRPTRGQLPTDTIASSFGLALILSNLALIAFGPEPRLIKTSLSGVYINLLDMRISAQRLLIPLIAVMAVLGVNILLYHTWLGRSLRAVAQQRTVASIVGVNVRRVSIATFAISGALAAAAGGLMGSVYMMQPAAVGPITLKAFAVVIIGGMGSVYGAVAAGLLLGITEGLASGLIGNQWKDVVAFVLVIAVLYLRPQGLFSKTAARA